MGSPPSVGQSGHVTPQNNGPAAPAQNHRSGSIIGRLFSRGNRSNAANRANNFVNENTPHNIGSGQASATHTIDQPRQISGNTRKGNFISRLFKRGIKSAAAAPHLAAAAPHLPVSRELRDALAEHTKDTSGWGGGVVEAIVNRLMEFATNNPDTGAKILADLNTVLSKLPIEDRLNVIGEFSMFLGAHPEQASRVISLLSQISNDEDMSHAATLLNTVVMKEERYQFTDNHIRDWGLMDDNRLKALLSDKDGNDSVEVLTKNAKAAGFLKNVLEFNGFNPGHFFGDKFQSTVISLAQVDEFPSPNSIDFELLQQALANPNIPSDKKIEAQFYLKSLQDSFPVLQNLSSEQLAPLFSPLLEKSGEEALASFKQSYTAAESLVKDLAKNSPDIDSKIQQTLGKDSSLEYAIFEILVSKHSEKIPNLGKILDRNYATLIQHNCLYTLKAIEKKDDKVVIDLLNTDKGKKWYLDLQNSNPAASVTVTGFIFAHQSDLPGYAAELAPKVTREGNSVRVEVWREQITQGSGEFLKALNPHLSPIPESFKVIIRGEQGLDAGGLSREVAANSYDAFIKNNFDEEGFPKWKGEGQKEEYEALGKMMAYAASRNGERPLGKKLGQNVFEAIKAIDGRNEFSRTSKLEIFGKVNSEFDQQFLANFINFLNKKDGEGLNKDDKVFIDKLVEAGVYDTLEDKKYLTNGALDYDKIKEHSKDFKNELFKEFEEAYNVDEKVMPLYYMAKGLAADPHHRGEINRMTAQQLDVAVQGEINKEDVLKALNFTPNNIAPANFLAGNLREAIKDWIGKASNSQLENLLKLMTGSPSLGKEMDSGGKEKLKGLNMIAIRDAEQLDSAHTCFNTLDINVDLINDAESMKNFLDDIGDGKSQQAFNAR